MKKTKKDLDPDPTFGSDLGECELELMGNFFFENFYTLVVCIQNDERVMGIILRLVC